MLLLALGAGPFAAEAGARHGLRRGLTDVEYTNPATAPTAFARTHAARASFARLIFYWPNVAPTPPPSRTAARDPNWIGYHWRPFDWRVRAARAAGLQPLVALSGAPPWAEGPGRPRSAPRSTWNPSATAFGDFAEAAARRYSGRIEPRVRYWQAWNEPNLDVYLSPQWASVDGRLRPTSPAIYRNLLNAFYLGVKAADPTNLVITAGTSPYGDVAGGSRMRPAYFWRRLLCVRGARRPRATRRCPDGPARFDALAHHPYPIGPPTQRALNVDDVAIPDLGRLTRPLKVAVRAGHVYPRRRKRLWVTELAYDTDPPDPDAVPTRRAARYLEASMYLTWRQGASAFAWFQLRDEPRGRDWAFSRQSGLYLRGDTIASDTPKPALAAYRFPFTAYHRSRRVVELWGLAPSAGVVVVERRTRRGRWRRVRRLRARRNLVFDGRLRARDGTLLRARQGGERSVTWRLARHLAWPPRRRGRR